mmetsp:Transcript_74409/g.131444  ORF Transcript_74409/g.131444 Transcript_74409/m.131444 type:complete len:399 (+) Transcript_74409:327-1523(+)
MAVAILAMAAISAALESEELPVSVMEASSATSAGSTSAAGRSSGSSLGAAGRVIAAILANAAFSSSPWMVELLRCEDFSDAEDAGRVMASLVWASVIAGGRQPVAEPARLAARLSCRVPARLVDWMVCSCNRRCWAIAARWEAREAIWAREVDPAADSNWLLVLSASGGGGGTGAGSRSQSSLGVFGEPGEAGMVGAAGTGKVDRSGLGAPAGRTIDVGVRAVSPRIVVGVRSPLGMALAAGSHPGRCRNDCRGAKGLGGPCIALACALGRGRTWGLLATLDAAAEARAECMVNQRDTRVFVLYMLRVSQRSSPRLRRLEAGLSSPSLLPSWLSLSVSLFPLMGLPEDLRYFFGFFTSGKRGVCFGSSSSKKKSNGSTSLSGFFTGSQNGSKLSSRSF